MSAPETLVFRWSWDELATVLIRHVEATGKLPNKAVRGYIRIVTTGDASTGLELHCEPLPNVTVLDTHRKPKP